LSLLWRLDAATGATLAVAQYRNAQTMTDRLSALSALVRVDKQSDEALHDFRMRFEAKPLALDHWLALQARIPRRETLERVRALEQDSAFDLRNPNRVQSLLGAFARGNPVAFHRPDGEGYRFLAAQLVRIDALNPQNAARLAKAFENWGTLEPKRRAVAQSTLAELNGRPGVSRDLADILERMLAGGTAPSDD
ncbi:MAG: aminopeptidase N C-terminal domain-containing protein, partial [Rhodanobacteraceae bacterium]